MKEFLNDFISNNVKYFLEIFSKKALQKKEIAEYMQIKTNAFVVNSFPFQYESDMHAVKNEFYKENEIIIEIIISRYSDAQMLGKFIGQLISYNFCE